MPKPSRACVNVQWCIGFKKNNQNKCFVRCWVGQPVSAVEPKHQDHDCNHQRSSVTLEKCCRRQNFSEMAPSPLVCWDRGGMEKERYRGMGRSGSTWVVLTYLTPVLVGGFTSLGQLTQIKLVIFWEGFSLMVRSDNHDTIIITRFSALKWRWWRRWRWRKEWEKEFYWEIPAASLMVPRSEKWEHLSRSKKRRIFFSRPENARLFWWW